MIDRFETFEGGGSSYGLLGFMEIHGDVLNHFFYNCFGADCELEMLAEVSQPFPVYWWRRFIRKLTNRPSSLDVLLRIARYSKRGLDVDSAVIRVARKMCCEHAIYGVGVSFEGDP